ncbi:hypothetical protein PFISCL1PPCAC_20186, partial [Pristionchus fissidentatus]
LISLTTFIVGTNPSPCRKSMSASVTAAGLSSRTRPHESDTLIQSDFAGSSRAFTSTASLTKAEPAP